MLASPTMKGQTIWVLVTGLALGFLGGYELGRGRGEAPSSGSAAKVEANAGEIPADWLKESDFGAADKFAGLTPEQRFVALKVVNQKPCDCGCPHGSVAKCKKDDPGCPRAPTIIAAAADLAKQGKSYEEILKAVEKPAAAARKPPEESPQRIELAAWTPVKGPKYAKVTVLEFSDFQ